MRLRWRLRSSHSHPAKRLRQARLLPSPWPLQVLPRSAISGTRTAQLSLGRPRPLTPRQPQRTLTVERNSPSSSATLPGMSPATPTLTVNAAPVAPSILTQPSSQTVTAGQTASFTVAATGTAPLSYQWNKNGTAITGATSSSYTTPATTNSDSGAQFTVVVSNTAGNVTSNAATLTVNAAPVAPSILTQPSSQTVTAGQTASFTVAATGTAPLSYQWNKNGTAITGATSSTYTTPATTSSDNGAQFTVVVSNTAGNVTSNADAHRKCGSGGAFDPHTAIQPNGYGRPDCFLHRGRYRHCPAQLSVEQERHSYHWGDLVQLHHASHNEL